MRLDNPLPEVLQHLILEQALATVDYSDAERERFRSEIYQEQSYQEQPYQEQPYQEQPYRAWLQQQGVTPEAFETWLDRELRIRKFQRQRWGKTVNSYFLQRKYQLDQVICSLIYLRERDIAQELYFRIVEGEQSFSEVATLYSERPDSERPDAAANGVVGPIELGKLPERLARMFYGGRPGQIWSPTAIGQWIIIARLDEILPVRLDETMRQTLFNELLESWINIQIKERFP